MCVCTCITPHMHTMHTHRVGDHILSVNSTSFIGEPLAKCKSFLKGLPKGKVKFVAMAPPKDVTGNGVSTGSAQSSVYTGVAVSKSGRQLVAKEGVVSAELYCYKNQPLGIEIEGGMDTSLQYVFISHLTPGSPAFECGVFRKGDQLVVVGEECIIGLTHKQTLDILNKAKGTVEVVVQRKESPKQARTPPPSLPVAKDDKDTTKQTVNKAKEVVVQRKESPKQARTPPSLPVAKDDKDTTKQTLNKAKGTVEVVVQRKESPKQVCTPPSLPVATDSKDDKDITNEIIATKQESSPQQKPSPPISPIPILLNSDSEAAPVSLTELSTMPEMQTDSDSSTEPVPIPSCTGLLTIKQLSLDADKDSTLQVKQPHSTIASSSGDSGNKSSDVAGKRRDVTATIGTNIVPEETFTIELHRTANEKLGLGITGGADNPRLQEIHVSIINYKLKCLYIMFYKLCTQCHPHAYYTYRSNRLWLTALHTKTVD